MNDKQKAQAFDLIKSDGARLLRAAKKVSRMPFGNPLSNFFMLSTEESTAYDIAFGMTIMASSMGGFDQYKRLHATMGHFFKVPTGRLDRFDENTCVLSLLLMREMVLEALASKEKDTAPIYGKDFMTESES